MQKGHDIAYLPKLILSLFVMAVAITGTVWSSENAHAGAYFGTGSVDPGGGGSSSPCTSDCGTCSGDTAHNPNNSVDCKGVSWIFYEATGNAGSDGVNMYFPAPYDAGDNKVTIPAECSINTKGRGFWHFGRNARAHESNTSMGPFFSKYTRLKGNDEREKDNDPPKYFEAVYTTTWNSGGGYGHMKTYNWGMEDYASKYYKTSGTPLSHSLQKKIATATTAIDSTQYQEGLYKEIYKATKYGSVSDVLKDFKTAYSYGVTTNDIPDAWLKEYGEEYTEDTFPSDLKFFCYWPEMENVSLTTYAYVGSTSGTKLSGPDVQSVQIGKNSTANYEDPYKDNKDSKHKNLKFQKWVNENGHKVDTSGAVSHDGSTLNITGQKKNRTFYAIYYAPVVLTGKAIDYTTGNYITEIDDVSSGEVIHGGSAEVSRRTNSNWHFVGWCSSKTKECTNLGTDKKYTKDPINSDTTVYPAYKPKVTITGQSVNENKTLNLDWSDTKTVVWGNSVTLTADATAKDDAGNEYGFLYWIGSNDHVVPVCPRADKKSYYACVSTDNNRILGVATLLEDRSYRAVYGRRTLTRHKVKYGTCTELGSEAITVPYNGSATASAWSNWDNWVYQGYTTSIASSSNCTSTLNTGSSYTVNPIKSDHDVYFVYRRRYSIYATLKNAGTRDAFNNLKTLQTNPTDPDSVDVFNTLNYSGTYSVPGAGNYTYTNGVWSTTIWEGDSFSVVFPDQVTINGNTYKRIGLYWDNGDANYLKNVCNNTTVKDKSSRTGDYTWSGSGIASCHRLWGAYVAVKHLTALAYDTSNNYIGDNQYTTATSKWPTTESYKRIPDQRVTVFNGETASLTRNTNIGYTFKGWKEACPWTWCSYFTNIDGSKASYLANDGTTYNVKSLTTNGVVYPIYEIRRKILTGISVDERGNLLAEAGISGLENKTDPVDYWEPAQITRGMAEGFTYYGWSESLNGATTGSYVTATSGATYISAASNSTIANIDNTYSPRGVYHVSSMTDSSITPVYARYDRNEFQGRARVSSGSSVNESSNTSTGWVESDTSQSLTIECPNTGCNATFDLHLKTIKGLGKTNYVVSRNKNGGSYSQLVTTPTSPFKPSTSGSAINRIGANYTETLYPGESVCYRISFKPYGGTYPNYRANSTFANATACVSARVSGFEGKSSVTGATTGTTNWQKTTTTERATIQNCSPTSGCQVNFNHRLKRTDGTLGWTDYTIARTSNLTDTTRGIANNTNVKSGTFNPSSPTTEQEVSSTGPFTLYPGMVVCETLTFKPHNSVVSAASTVTTKICASALGSAQPDDPTPSTCNEATDPSCSSDPDGDTGSNALVDIEVKNETVTKYNTYRRVVYGKPGDTLEYRGSYNPNLQYTFNLKPEQMKFENTILSNGPNNPCMLGKTSICEINGATITNRVRSLFNEYVEPDWNNDFLVRKVNFGGKTSLAYNYTNGDPNKREETNDYTVLAGDVGKSLDENAEINYSGNRGTHTTPVQVSFTNSNGKNLGNVLTSNRNRTAYARIPYNYTTDIRIPKPDPVDPTKPEPDPGDPSDLNSPSGPSTPTSKVPVPEIVYAGEEKTIDVVIDIKPKPNSVTNNPGDPDYATRTGESTMRIIVYVANQEVGGSSAWPRVGGGTRNDNLCSHFSSAEYCGYYNPLANNDDSENLGGDKKGAQIKKKTTFNIPDYDAGKQVCVAAAIFPASSGIDTNLSADGDMAWRISESRCFVIAKRPNLQVLGGGMYSGGNIYTSTAEKRNVYGIYPVKLSGNDNTTVFGSWGEHQVTIAGIIQGFASGAATGYFGTTSTNVPASGRTPKSQLGGSFEGLRNSYCLRVPLNFPNTPCASNTGIGTAIKAKWNTTGDKSKLIARFTDVEDDDGIEYEKIIGDYTVGAMTTVKGLTKVIHATGNINITGNLIYEDNYTSLTQIPKLIVYAESNINIDCYVTRIDAVLIAGRTNGANGVVNTCPTSYSVYTGDITSAINWKQNGITLINTRANSNPLKINGTIIANKLIANRTYGAAKGINSVVPAEVIDYDATLYGWGMRESEASASGKLQTVYLHEVAPRY